MGVKCFFIEPSGKHRLYLRRYVSSGDESGKCSVSDTGYHNAMNLWQVIFSDKRYEDAFDMPEKTFGLWPEKCPCGYVFADSDSWMRFDEEIMRRQDTGEELTRRDAPPGAMWFADWMLSENSNLFRGPDGHCLLVKLPNGNDWMIDAPASNCTMPSDFDHKCWVRRGVPPNITINKDGLTCAAGGGSIQSGNYHGFLVNGEFNP